MSGVLQNAGQTTRWVRGAWLSCLLALAALPSAHAAETVSVCYEAADVLPWRSTDGQGLNFELLQTVAQRTRVQFSFTALPWKRCLDGLRTSEYEAAIGASFSPEREEFAVYPGMPGKPDVKKRMYTDRYIFLRRAGSNVQWNGKTLSGAGGRVGIQLGYSVANDLRALGLTVDDGAPGGHELLQKLQAGHVDVVAMLEGEARWLLDHERRFAGLEILPQALSEKPYYMIFSKAYKAGHAAQAEKLWAAIEAAREGGGKAPGGKPRNRP